MNHQNLAIAIVVDKNPAEVFDAINDVRGWWTENVEGCTHNLNDEFEVRFGDVHYSKQKLIEVIPGSKIVWLVTDSNLSFIEDKTEWTNTRISFEIAVENNKTHVMFTHLGLTAAIECYDACSNAWNDYIKNSLRKLINTGKGEPTLQEQKVKTTMK